MLMPGQLYGTTCVPMKTEDFRKDYGIINANNEFQENFLIHKPATWDLASTQISKSFETVGTMQGFATDSSYETGGLGASQHGEDFFEAIASFVGALAELCVAQPVLFEGPPTPTSIRPPYKVHSFKEFRHERSPHSPWFQTNTDITSSFGVIEENKSCEMFPSLRDVPWPFILKPPLVSLKELFPSNLPQLQEALRYKPHGLNPIPQVWRFWRYPKVQEFVTQQHPATQQVKKLVICGLFTKSWWTF